MTPRPTTAFRMWLLLPRRSVLGPWQRGRTISGWRPNAGSIKTTHAVAALLQGCHIDRDWCWKSTGFRAVAGTLPTRAPGIQFSRSARWYSLAGRVMVMSESM